MTTLFSVAAPEQLRGRAAALVATFPLACRLATGPAADIALVDGAAPWAVAAAAAIAGGARRLLVIDPGPDDALAIERLAAAAEVAGASVVLGETFAGNPAVAGYAERIHQRFGVHGIAALGPGEPAALALAALRVARAIGLADVEVADAQATGHALLVAATARRHGEPVLLRLRAVVTTGAAPRIDVRSYAPDGLGSLTLPAADTARPAHAVVTAADGALSLPTIYDTAHRAALRSLLADAPAGADLRAFARDAAAAASFTASAS